MYLSRLTTTYISQNFCQLACLFIHLSRWVVITNLHKNLDETPSSYTQSLVSFGVFLRWFQVLYFSNQASTYFYGQDLNTGSPVFQGFQVSEQRTHKCFFRCARYSDLACNTAFAHFMTHANGRQKRSEKSKFQTYRCKNIQTNRRK